MKVRVTEWYREGPPDPPKETKRDPVEVCFLIFFCGCLLWGLAEGCAKKAKSAPAAERRAR